ncbi:hypothetical protein QSV08_02700 [Maribacter sp. BPC-D8]|uniref:hypothetical protein n=1 Tax=Maribacter sp. BPC-D8 TaxID=3053613 RepID=UPI002B4942C1|nr:hypothetical protein [Maribacter sp. BPC-D8]WRI30152.1 hypothetical protein QSV08_02700 [Maribacter sp. BPC-D8]
MGTWNSEIFGNDTSCEVQEYFYEKYNLGLEPDEISKLITQKFNYSLNDFEDKNNVLFALGFCLWETKSLRTPELNEIESIIERGEDLKILKGLNATDDFLNERQKYLVKFLKKISVEKSNPKKRKKPPKEINEIIQTGSCLSFEYEKGTYGGIIVIDSEYFNNRGELRFALTNIYQKEIPDFNTFLKAKIRKFSWETVYGQANRKAAFEDKTARIWTYPLSYEKSKEREQYFSFNNTFFKVCGQLPTFTQCLLGTSGIRVEYKKEYSDFENSLIEELLYLTDLDDEQAASFSEENIEELNLLLINKSTTKK